MIHRPLVLLAAIGVMTATAVSAAPAGGPPIPTWGKLVEVKAKHLKEVYLLPGADFRGYTKIMLDPAEVDFVKGWVRKMNSEYGVDYGYTTDADAAKIAAAVRKGIDDIFAKDFAKAGYQVVTTPGPDVLRLSLAIVDLSISAPSTVTMSMGSVRTVDAGQAVIVVQARDSESGQILGGAIDPQIMGENDQGQARSQVNNQADFSFQFDLWAQICIKGLEQLKKLSPVDSTGAAITPAAK